MKIDYEYHLPLWEVWIEWPEAETTECKVVEAATASQAKMRVYHEICVKRGKAKFSFHAFLKYMRPKVRRA